MAPSFPGRAPLAWFGPLHDITGFADEARGFLRALEDHGHAPAARDLGWSSGTTGLTAAGRRALDAQLARRVRAGSVVVHSALPSPRQIHVDDAVNVARAMFETDAMPAAWLAPLLAREQVWVPSRHNLETFRRGGLPASKLRVIGGTMDFELYDPAAADPWPLPVEDERFVFFSNFDFNDRKGWQHLLLAWATAFRDDDGVVLVLKTGNLVKGEEYVRARIADFLARHVDTRAGRIAPIELLTDRLDAPEMPRLYAAADAFVLASRGEGWGRPYMEAMAMDLPTVGPRFGGSLEFMHDANSFLFDGELVPVATEAEVMTGLYDGHRWFEPDVDSLVAILRSIERDRGPARARAAGARAELIARFGPDATAERLATLALEVIDRATRATAGAVAIRGSFGSGASLAVVNDAFADELTARGYALHHRAQRAGATDSLAPGITHSWPPDFDPVTAGPTAIVLPWEYGSPPREWVEKARERADRVWVPSEYVREGYIAGGMPPGIVEVVPNGVDLGRFTPDGPVRELPPAACRFLFVGGSIWRKGIDLLVDAWQAAFGPDDDVQLVVKDFGTDSHYRGQTAGARLRGLAERGDVAPVVYIDEDLAPDALPALYRAADVLVVPYRGEGFCLPALEGMACGLPVIHTEQGPTREFVPADGGWAVAADRVVYSGEGLPPLAGDCYVHEVRHDALVDALRSAAADPGDRKARGRRAIEAARRHGWDAAAAVAERALQTLAAEELPLAREIAPAQVEARDALVLYAPDWHDESAWGPALERWCAVAGADDPVTLALFLGEADPDALVESILTRLAAAGYPEESLPDLALCDGGSVSIASLVAAAHAVLLDERQAQSPPAELVRRASRVVAACDPDLAALVATLVSAPTAIPA